MPSTFNLRSLTAAALAALTLLLFASGAPVGDETAESLAGDTSGEEGELVEVVEEEPSDLKKLLQVTQRHKKEFEDEFQTDVIFLEHYKSASFPSRCPSSNFNKEACLQRLAQGLLTYTVLLKHVATELPNSSIVTAAKSFSGPIITMIKNKMKHSERVTPLTSSQEEQLLAGIKNPDSFQKKMMAHSILYHLHIFLVDANTSMKKMEKNRWRTAGAGLPSISPL
ncbi:interleukin-6-like [Stegastes partitus]|uniref:Interleukin-6 n=1 Tax=Stegastes partitus TaxID=144197 RepID=A0A9Y4NLG5_9TELE|nr:PREDICTED: interleukin-6-like [Stegastes partitus]